MLLVPWIRHRIKYMVQGQIRENRYIGPTTLEARLKLDQNFIIGVTALLLLQGSNLQWYFITTPGVSAD